MDLGGFKSEAYRKISPQGKVPALAIRSHVDANADTDARNSLTVAESDTVARYLLKTYAAYGPSFQPDLPLSNEIARFHDMYLTTIQGCLYKASPPFGTFGNRKKALQEYSDQLYVISDNFMKNEQGRYLCGEEVSLADATLFPSIVFAAHMFPKFDDGHDDDALFSRAPIPPKVDAWFRRMVDTDSAFQKVYNEVCPMMMSVLIL